MNIIVSNDSVSVSYNKEFMLPIMIFMPSLFAMILYQYTPPNLFKWVLVIFFIASLSGLIAHLTCFMKGKDVFLWKVDRFGFYFQAQRTHLLSLKPPIPHPWSKVAKVLYVKKYITLDHEMDSVSLKNIIIIVNKHTAQTKILDTLSPKISFDLFKVMQALSPNSTAFESLEEYNDS
ncbi:MAG: hypothetical protein GQ582_09765 [Methyloprofundus sp.]|nr:hypothetical protein [Methyloprofundus sp.]